MSNDKTTLADVQPGGMVRLGDALPPLPASSAQCLTTGAPLFSVEKMKLYALAALSAQPSPEGQDVLFIEELAELRRLVPSVNQKHALDAAIAALAARQPVSETDAYQQGFRDGQDRTCTVAARQPVGQGDSRSEKAETFLRQYLTYLRSSPRQGLRPRWCDVYEALEVAIEALAARQPGVK